MERELGSNNMAHPHTSFIFNRKDVGPRYSSAPEFSPDIHVSSIPPHEMHPISTSFISQSSNDVMQFPSTNLSYSGACQPSISVIPKENNEMSWCPVSCQSTLSYPVSIAADSNQIRSTCNVTSDDLKHEEWADLPDILVGGLDDTYPILPDLRQFAMERELGSNNMAHPHTNFIFNREDVGPRYSSAPEFSPDIHVSSIPPHEMHPIGTSFISQPSNDVMQFPSTNLLYSGECQPSISVIPKENNEMSWSPVSRQSTLSYPDRIAAGSNQIRSTCNVSSDDHKHEEWADFPDILVDGSGDSWQELLNSTNTTKLRPQALSATPDTSPQFSVQTTQLHQAIPSNYGQLAVISNPLSSSTTNVAKRRMRWTPELHESFLEAVNQLGGSEKATPKGVLNLMKVEGLTISNVKSHLQKYRTVRYRPEPEQVTSEKKNVVEELSPLSQKGNIGLAEALHMQMEVQKQLHEHLERQRKLQLQLEEQGRHLQMMLVQQSKAGGETLKTSSTLNNFYTQPSGPKITEGVHSEPRTASTIPESKESSRQVGGKQKMVETEPHADAEFDPLDGCQSPPHKRAKAL